MSLNKENLKSICNFIEKMLIINNAVNHKLNIITEYAKYNNIIITFKTDF